ncbi:ultraviolet-B receptor UVR8 [Micractinium conductrix]|uniref:Ultraviolet-B receptor UVR8 n=1 Tax=Micractinium conductrix TaxID=554055 RepID=A0A2P6VBD1_9CHLO|nr:ultraviolet-B receptor UVR8 [Micractinium conductrix]|eukprot:PSC71361.1 ultraviolet-B receptor UVR8 [Micractinium conductrix]
MRRVLATFGNGDCGRLGHSLVDHAAEEVPRVVRSLLGGPPLAAVAAGGAHTVALDADGAVHTWGLNDKGQLGLGHDREETELGLPQEVPMPERCVALAAGYFHTLALGESGAVWAFGCNGKGQLGLGKDVVLAREPRLVKGLQDQKVVALAAGMEHSLALTAGGEVYSWGASAHGRLGHGAPTSLRLFGAGVEFKPRLIRAFEALRIKQISAGQMHSAAISADGDAFMWGYGKFNQLGFGNDEDVQTPAVLPPLRGNTAAIACGWLHTLAVAHGGAVLSWGANQNGVLGHGHEKDQTPKWPTRIPCLEAKQVAAGWKHSAAVTTGGRLCTWGWGGSQGTAYSFEKGSGTGGQLGHGNDFDYWSPHQVEWLQLEETEWTKQVHEGGETAWRVKQVACGLNHMAAIIELSPGVQL